MATVDKQEIQYVRAEKAADEAMTEKLIQMYGKTKTQDTTRQSRKSWKCSVCSFNNYDCRFACGNCLNVVEGKLSDEKPNIAKACNNRKLTEPNFQLIERMGRCYRVWVDKSSAAAPSVPTATTTVVSSTGAASGGDLPPHYDEEDDLRMSEDFDDPNCSVSRDKVSGQVVLTWIIPPQYNKFIVGPKGATLLDIQRTTGAIVTINPVDGKNALLIRAPEKHSVCAAKLRIDIIVEEFKDKVAYTHFVSIPLGTIPTLQPKLTALIDEMKLYVAACPNSNIESSLFQKPSKLHLTLLMLRLYTEDEKERAAVLMKDIQKWVADEFSAIDAVHVHRVNYMNDDPSKVNVLYLELAPNPTREKLVRLIERISQAFLAAGLALPKDIEHNEKNSCDTDQFEVAVKWGAKSPI
eukprot:PhF_6_TR29209/c0_g1_i1/m.42735/K18666/ASCC1; activating signal cointegrator complex subunit 1